jgi:hypothetical protein
MTTQSDIAKHLDLSERRLRDVLGELGINSKAVSLDVIRVAYIRDLRNKAAGRGGDDQGALSKARTKQALADAAMKELQYYRELKLLVPAAEIEPALREWAAVARGEVQNAVEKLLAAIRSQHGVEMDADAVEGILHPAFRAIAAYPALQVPDGAQDEGGAYER